MDGRISFHDHEPHYLKYFRYQKNKLGGDNYSPALGVGDAIAKHEATNPDDKGDDGEFPQIHEWDGKELERINHPEDCALRLIHEELKSSSFVFYKGYFNKQE